MPEEVAHRKAIGEQFIRIIHNSGVNHGIAMTTLMDVFVFYLSLSDKDLREESVRELEHAIPYMLAQANEMADKTAAAVAMVKQGTPPSERQH
jgi:hypothetical protein